MCKPIARFSVLVWFLCAIFSHTAAGAFFSELSDFFGKSKCVEAVVKHHYITGEEAFIAYTRGDHANYTFPNIVMIGDSTIRTKYVWLELINKTQNVDYLGLNDGDCDKMKSVVTTNRDIIEKADVVLWNYGLHALQLRPCREGPYHSLAEYKQNLHCMAATISEVARGKPVFYKLTNTIAEQKFKGEYRRCLEKLAKPEMALREDYSIQFSHVGTDNLNNVEREMASSFHFHLLNPYTEDMHRCTRRKDGRHYPPLVPQFWENSMMKINAHLHHKAREQRQLILSRNP